MSLAAVVGSQFCTSIVVIIWFRLGFAVVNFWGRGVTKGRCKHFSRQYSQHTVPRLWGAMLLAPRHRFENVQVECSDNVHRNRCLRVFFFISACGVARAAVLSTRWGAPNLTCSCLTLLLAVAFAVV